MSTLELDWRRFDRSAWTAYRKWEDVNFPVEKAKPWFDPSGMADARRAFEKMQEMERRKFFQKARYGRST